MSVLRVTGLAGHLAGKTLEFSPGALTIGRDANNTVSLVSDMATSRCHLRLFFSNGAWYCADAGSSNGTIIGGQRLGTQPVLIRGEIELRFGAQVWRIKPESGVGQAISPLPTFNKGDGKGTCRRCGTVFGFFAGASAASRAGLCKVCDSQIADSLKRFQSAFQGLVRTRPLLSPSDIQEVHQLAQRMGLPSDEALGPLRADCVGVLYRQFAIAKQDGVIEPDEERLLRQVQRGLFITDSDAAYVWREVGMLKTLHGIRTGKLEPVGASMVLPPGEICYYEGDAIYHRELASGTRYVQGKLLVTTKRVVFLAFEGGFDFPLSKVATVEIANEGVLLGLTRKQGAGYYQASDPEVLVALIEHLLNRHHRLSDLGQSASRTVPQYVKAEVWARDGGKCVECGDGQYLEFDHIIPYHLGGATSVDNLQLLCRGCNQKKGGRL